MIETLIGQCANCGGNLTAGHECFPAKVAHKEVISVANYVGMPAALHLDLFGHLVFMAFGAVPYLVGSATRGKSWRDVDVRLILADDEFAALGLHVDRGPCAKLDSLNMAFAALARQMTGLPVDFQIQQRTKANKSYSQEHGHGRIALIPSSAITVTGPKEEAA